MEGLGRNAYIKQGALYIKNKDYQRAYEFCREFVQNFPDDMISHFMLSKAAFWAGKYEEAAAEGRKAFNMSKAEEDLAACAIITATAHYELKQYDKGYELLKTVEKTKTSEEIEKLLFIFSVAMDNEEEALKHVEYLMRLNKQAAEELILRFLEE